MKSLLIIKSVITLSFINFSEGFFFNPRSSCSLKIIDQGYQCCLRGCVPIYTDEDGDWAFENNEWCGCGKDYNSYNSFNFTDNNTDTEIDTNKDNNEDNNKENETDTNTVIDRNKCSMEITNLGYPCCTKDCKVVYTDEDGSWGFENNKWCGCNPNQEEIEDIFNKYYQRIEEILSDDKEIEKKWLIEKEKIPYDLKGETVSVEEIKQTYICFDPEIRVREYTRGKKIVTHEMTIKTNLTEDGLVRDEVNIDINKQQYENLVKKQEGNTINKTRYQFFADGEVIAIDIFHGDLEGLAYMEIEFPTKVESLAYKTPDWVIKDVTDDIRYKNGHLARYGIPDNEEKINVKIYNSK